MWGGNTHGRPKNKTDVNPNAGVVCVCVCVYIYIYIWKGINFVHSILRKYFHDAEKSGPFLARKRRHDFTAHSKWLTHFGKIMVIHSESRFDTSVQFRG